MSNNRDPRRPSPAVYRRRRIVVLIIALIVVAVLAVGVTTIVRGVSGLFGGDEETSTAPSPNDAAASQNPSGGSSASPSASPSASAGKAGTASPSGAKKKTTKCSPDSIEVTASTDKKSYSGKAKPKLTLSVKNVSDTACIIDVGTKQLEFDITSGSDRIWSSRDCQDDSKNPDATVNKIKFKSGDKKSASMTWQRIRSVKGCKAGLPDVKPGTYRLETKVGSNESKGAYFILK
ncbi:hypothetical protein [Spelaeicoccus albus]|uniref:Flagellar basal body-associated protein FliL n=1 Tax=Spelaeicoccus albus TaxID=1280376 RepID=A0A7Z0IJD4_9MICO|nr:hypothetical protein [Spelaeicoccus albus]NYI69408.1 flagellar basal body-associated protein FliL [Spelaeicoccus albus]